MIINTCVPFLKHFIYLFICLHTAQSVNPLLIVLAMALGACWILIAAQTIFICKRTHSKHSGKNLYVR